MRFSKLKLVLLVGCVALAPCRSVCGQSVATEQSGVAVKLDRLPVEEPAPVIHVDLEKADEHEEPEHCFNYMWARADWFLAWIRGASFPPLVTVGATSQPLPGALGQEGTIIRFAGQPSPHDRQGGRFQV